MTPEKHGRIGEERNFVIWDRRVRLWKSSLLSERGMQLQQHRLMDANVLHIDAVIESTCLAWRHRQSEVTWSLGHVVRRRRILDERRSA